MGLRFEVSVECRKSTEDGKGVGDLVMKAVKAVEVENVDEALFVAARIMNATILPQPAVACQLKTKKNHD